MKYKGWIITAIALSVYSQSVSAVPFTFNARSLGMGNVSVATADMATAAWANPAMLTNQRPKDDFSLLVGAGAFLRDDDELVTNIEDFQDADDKRRAAQDANDPVNEALAVIDMRRIVREVEGKVIAPEVTGIAAVGMAFDTFAMAVSIRSDIIAGGTITDLSCDITEPGCDPSELFSEDYNILDLEGVAATEFGVSFAKALSFGLNKPVSRNHGP